MRKQGWISMGAATVGAAMLLTATQWQSAAQTSPAPQDVQQTGKVVALQTYFAGVPELEEENDAAMRCIRMAGPVGLDIGSGIIVLGSPERNMMDTFARMAGKEVEVTGKLYTRYGTKYLAVDTIMSQQRQDDDRDQDDKNDDDNNPGVDQ